MGQMEYRVENWDIMQHWMGAFNDHTLRGVLYFEGHIEEERLWGAVKRSFGTLPQLACGFFEGRGRPRWRQGDFGREDILRTVPAGDVEQTLQTYITEKLDTERGPQIRVTILRGEEGDTLCVVVSHMLCDGVGFKEYLYLLARLYSDAGAQPPVPGDRTARQAIRALTPRQRWEVVHRRYRLSSQKSKLYFPLMGGDTPFVALRRMEPADFDRVRKHAKAQGATVNDMLLTAYLRALGEVLGAIPAALPCPVDLRKFLPDREKARFCNLTSFLFCEIESAPGESFDATLAKVARTMAEQKDDISCLHATLLLETAFALIPYPIVIRELGRFFKNPPIAMTNIGIIDSKKLCFGELAPRDAFVTGSIKYAPYFQLAVTTFGGRATLSINFYGTKEDREKIDAFLQSVEAQLLGAQEKLIKTPASYCQMS